MKFSSKTVVRHAEAPRDGASRMESLAARVARREEPSEERATTYAVAVCPPGYEGRPQRRMEEIVSLVEARSDEVAGSEVLMLGRVDARTYIGRGLAEGLGERAHASGATTLVVDAMLSPSQMRNLEDVVGMRLVDREAVILDVFLRRARTRQARIQVEIAQLEYLRPRIRGLGLEMDQQAGGLTAARGPGETASELLARQLDGRLADLRRDMAKITRATGVQRHRRRGCQRAALVGYTNAGKTSLMNALTGAGLSARDAVFETLDATSRSLTRHGGEVVLSDTVGFIRALPERLLASFASTLAEACEADLLVMVVDLSDHEWRLHLDTTEAVLRRLGAVHLPRYYVFNKCDLLPTPPTPVELAEWSRGYPSMALSTRDEEAVAELRRRLVAAVRTQRVTARVFVARGDRRTVSYVHKNSLVLATESRANGMRLTIEATPEVVARVRGASRRRTS